MKVDHLENFDKEDYYLSEEGYVVFTEAYHLKRGYCCENNCRHCPYKKEVRITNRNEFTNGEI